MSRRRSLFALLLSTSAGWLVTPGCSVEGSPAPAVVEPDAPAPGLCPSCQVSAGGETSDFPGAGTHACARANHMLALDEHAAAALAFVDVAEMRARLEREIDVPMHWNAQPTERSRVDGGYQPETRLHALTKVVSYTYIGPDPALCAEGLCRLPGVSEPFEPCSEVLVLGTEVELHTDDGAVEARLEGWTLWDSAWGESVALNHGASAALTDAQGTLELGSATPPVRGKLQLEVIYGPHPSQTRGYLRVVLEYVSAIRSAYDFDLPIWGGWGPSEDERWERAEDGRADAGGGG